MSQQRYSLILLIGLLGVGLSAQTGFSLHNDLNISPDSANPGMLEHQVISLDTRAGKHRITVINDLLIRTKILANHTQKLYNRMSIGDRVAGDSWAIGAGAAATMYGDSETLALYPMWKPLATQTRRYQFTAHIKAEKQISGYTMSSAVQARHLGFDASEFSWDTFDFVPAGAQEVNDYRAEYALTADLGRGIGVLGYIDHQDGDYDATRLYRMTTTKLGITHNATLNDWLSVQSQIAWQHRESEAIHSEKANLYTTDLRLRLRLNPALSGFVHYTNRSCSDAELSEMLLISNYLRTQLKYSFAYDPNATSYISLGAKYSPENLANAIFAETDLQAWGAWYVGAALDLRSDRLTGYSGKLSYHLSTGSELNLSYQYRDNKVDRWHYSYAGLGVNLYY